MQPITTAHLAEIQPGECLVIEDGEIGIVSEEEAEAVLADGGRLVADHARVTVMVAGHGAEATAERLTAETGEALIRTAVEAVREASVVAETAGLRRAEAVAGLVAVCGGNQSEAARRLGIHQSRVNKPVARVRAEREADAGHAASSPIMA